MARRRRHVFCPCHLFEVLNQFEIHLRYLNRPSQVSVFVKRILDLGEKLKFFCFISFPGSFCSRSGGIRPCLNLAKPRKRLHDFQLVPLRTDPRLDLLDKIPIGEFRVRKRFRLGDLLNGNLPLLERNLKAGIMHRRKCQIIFKLKRGIGIARQLGGTRTVCKYKGNYQHNEDYLSFHTWSSQATISAPIARLISTKR